jgi:uncharacterized damage-inducible protein DinB
MSDVISSIAAEFRRYKALAEAAMAQLGDEELTQPAAGDDNSIPVIVWHIAGNLCSRFTDFRTTDGEKPWRRRDEEFEVRVVSRETLFAKWESGWAAAFDALGALTDADLHEKVTIRGQPHSVHQALHRLLAHTSYHVGQIVFIAKSIRGSAWHSLSIPKGQSEAYNQHPHREIADSHAAALNARPRSGTAT